MFLSRGKLKRDNRAGGEGSWGCPSGSEHCVLLLPLNRCVSLCLLQHKIKNGAEPNAFSKEIISCVVPTLGKSLFPFLPPSKCQ